MSSITFNNGSLNYRGYTLNNFNFGFVDARYQQQNPSNEALPSSSPTENNPYGYSFTGASKYISLDNFSGITGENIGPAFLIAKDPNDTSTALKVSALNTGDASRSLIAIGGTTDDSFTGSAADDLFVGGGGYDVFIGNGGSDVYVLGAAEGFRHLINPTLTSKIVCKTIPETDIETISGAFAFAVNERGTSKKIAELKFDPEDFVKFCDNAGITLTKTFSDQGATYFNYLNSAIRNNAAIQEAIRSMLYVLSDDGICKPLSDPSFRLPPSGGDPASPPSLDEREGVLDLLSKNEGPLGGLATVSGLKKSYLDEESKIAYASLKATGNAGGSFVVNDLADTTGYRIVGSSRGDTITTGSGNDYIWGDAGNDTISGGDGHDYIAGGLGKNNLTGGRGDDTFVIDASGGRGRTYVTDFSEGDKIVLQNAGNLVFRYRNNESNSGFIEIISSGRAVATIRTSLSLAEVKDRVQE